MGRSILSNKDGGRRESTGIFLGTQWLLKPGLRLKGCIRKLSQTLNSEAYKMAWNNENFVSV